MEPSAAAPSEELFEIVDADSLDFDSWTLLILEIEKTYSDNINISLVYESFLSRFPLCHGYWKTYANHKARLCGVEKAFEIFERAVQSATYSVGLWVDYCSFSIHALADPSEIRRVFERGLSFVGKDFLCYKLWDMYVRFELSQQQWSSLAHILVRSLKFPTKSLHKYYDNFREFVAFVEADMSFPKSGNLEPDSAASDIEVVTSKDEIYHVIKELQDSTNVELRSKVLYKLVTIGERFYSKACQLHEQIDYFENYIDREYFHVKQLADEELENWHNYLDFIEKQEDFDWAVKLYERCLIPCANYPEFWMRYVEFMESKGGRELSIFALERATKVFLKNVHEVHIFNARFREQIGDIKGARAAFLLCDTECDLSFIETATEEANMEKRLGNLDTALDIYDKALKVAAEQQKLHLIPILYIQFSVLKYLITGSANAAIDLLIEGIQRVPHSRLLLEELINFAMMHEGSRHLNVVDSVIASAITRGPDVCQSLSSKDREDLSQLYLKYVDQCGTTLDIRKAWNRHMKSFPHLIRSTSSRKHPTNHHLNELLEEIERISHLPAKMPSGVYGIDHIVQKSADERHKSLLSKNPAIQPQEATANQLKEKDDGNSIKEKTAESSPQVLQSEDDAGGEFKRLKHQSKADASGLLRSSPALHQQGENASRSIDSIHDTLLPCQEATSELNELQVSHTHDQIGNEQEEEQEHEVEMHRKPFSLESLSLYNQEKESQDLTLSTLTALEDTVPAIIRGKPSTAGENPFLTTESVKQNELDEQKSESSPSSPVHRNQGKTDPPKEVPSENAETCREMNHMLTDVSVKSHGQSQRQHQEQQRSPLAQGSTAHTGNITQVPNQNQAWPVTMQPQNSLLASQRHVSHQPGQSHPPQAQMVQYPMSSVEQPGLIPNTEAYNQMWQYQYQQQQYQQQLLQMQQSYLMQQQQQSPYVQPQQQYVQHQQQLQPLQLQQQQYQLYQQQGQYQQYQQGYQYEALLQQYQQQQEQGYQQWMQQHQLQEYMRMQQYPQPQDVHQNQQQQIAAVPPQMWNSSHDQQGQGMTLPHTTSTPTGSETPYTQQISAHGVAQPVVAGAPTNVASPRNHQQSPHGAPSILGSGTSQSLGSPSFQQTPQS